MSGEAWETGGLTMTDYTELCHILRTKMNGSIGLPDGTRQLADIVAADAIERLRTENERLKEQLAEAVGDMNLDRNCALCKHLQNQRFCAEQCQVFFDNAGIKRTHPKWEWRGEEKSE